MKFLKKCLFTYFWLCWDFVAVCGLPLVGTSRGYSWLQYLGCSLWWLLLLGSRALGYSCFSSWSSGLAALWHMESSQPGDRTDGSCTGRWILYHCTTWGSRTTREAPQWNWIELPEGQVRKKKKREAIIGRSQIYHARVTHPWMTKILI